MASPIYTQPSITKSITHSFNINPSITLPAIPAVAMSGMGAFAILGAPFNVFTMLGMVLASFFGPFFLGAVDRGYAYSFTVSEMTRGDYRRLSKEAVNTLHTAVKSGKPTRFPLDSITGDERDESLTLIVTGKKFQLEEPKALPIHESWDRTLQEAGEVYTYRDGE